MFFGTVRSNRKDHKHTLLVVGRSDAIFCTWRLVPERDKCGRAVVVAHPRPKQLVDKTRRLGREVSEALPGCLAGMTFPPPRKDRTIVTQDTIIRVRNREHERILLLPTTEVLEECWFFRANRQRQGRFRGGQRA